RPGRGTPLPFRQHRSSRSCGNARWSARSEMRNPSSGAHLRLQPQPSQLRGTACEGESYRGFLCERGFRFYAEGHKSTFSTAFMSSSILLADTKAGISHNTVFLVVEQRAFRGSSMGEIYLSRFEVVETANRMI